MGLCRDIMGTHQRPSTVVLWMMMQNSLLRWVAYQTCRESVFYPCGLVISLLGTVYAFLCANLFQKEGFEQYAPHTQRNQLFRNHYEYEMDVVLVSR